MKVSDSIKKNAVLVNKFLRKELKGNPKQLYDASAHLIIHGGKRLRPFMVMKSCMMLGGKQSDAMAAAGAVEMIHNLLLHMTISWTMTIFDMAFQQLTKNLTCHWQFWQEMFCTQKHIKPYQNQNFLQTIDLN